MRCWTPRRWGGCRWWVSMVCRLACGRSPWHWRPWWVRGSGPRLGWPCVAWLGGCGVVARWPRTPPGRCLCPRRSPGGFICWARPPRARWGRWRGNWGGWRAWKRCLPTWCSPRKRPCRPLMPNGAQTRPRACGRSASARVATFSWAPWPKGTVGCTTACWCGAPLAWYARGLRIPDNGLQPGGGTPALWLRGRQGVLPVGFWVCQEDMRIGWALDQLPAATVWLNPGNLGWFDSPWARALRLQAARARAAETGRPVLRAETGGTTAHIDHQGRVVAAAPAGADLQGVVQPHTGTTPYVRWSLWWHS